MKVFEYFYNKLSKQYLADGGNLTDFEVEKIKSNVLIIKTAIEVKIGDVKKNNLTFNIGFQDPDGNAGIDERDSPGDK